MYILPAASFVGCFVFAASIRFAELEYIKCERRKGFFIFIPGFQYKYDPEHGKVTPGRFAHFWQSKYDNSPLLISRITD